MSGLAGVIGYDFRPADPNGPLAQELLREYFGEILSRGRARAATDDEIAAALADDPNYGLVPPDGLFLVAFAGDVASGCAGLRLHPDRTGEVKRVYVRPRARRTGLGTLLMDEIERHARECGVTRLRLDTRRDLTEARAMYERRGYWEAAPFPGSALAQVWFEKDLAPTNGWRY